MVVVSVSSLQQKGIGVGLAAADLAGAVVIPDTGVFEMGRMIVRDDIVRCCVIIRPGDGRTRLNSEGSGREAG